jgi:hypothetical protein
VGKGDKRSGRYIDDDDAQGFSNGIMILYCTVHSKNDKCASIGRLIGTRHAAKFLAANAIRCKVKPVKVLAVCGGDGASVVARITNESLQ